MSLICRRWRNAVYRTITTLPLGAPAPFVHLPLVTERMTSNLSNDMLTFDLPSSLCSFSMHLQFRLSSEINAFAHLTLVTTLTKLRLACPASADAKHFLSRNTSITKLALLVSNFEDFPIFFTGLSFPQLCSVEEQVQQALSCRIHHA